MEAHPVQYAIPGYTPECLYDTLEKDEYLTMSLFIGEGDVLAATAVMEGPIAGTNEIRGAADLLEANRQYGSPTNAKQDYATKGKPTDHGDDGVNEQGALEFRILVSFEELTMVHHDDHDDDYNHFYGDDDESHYHEIRMNQRKKRRQQREEEKRRMNGEPWEKTFQVHAAGWYRVCTLASEGEVNVEFEMRKSSELGIPQREGGHVPSLDLMVNHYEQPEVSDEHADAADEKDLEQAMDVITVLQKYIDEIKEKQRIEQHRVQVHDVTNAHSHYLMRMGSFFETLLYVCVTGLQVQTMRKWFAGGPLLGR